MELLLIDLSAAIRDKKEWRRKVQEPEVRSKWVEEVQRAAAGLTPPPSPADLAYLWAELDWLCTQRDESTGIEPSTADGVWQSDSLLPPPLLQRLQGQVRGLLEERVRVEDRDWHPGSKGQVWDLVHPSLHCLVAGRSRVVDEDVPLHRALQMQGGGEPISFADFRSRAAAIRSAAPSRALFSSMPPPASAATDAAGEAEVDDSDAAPPNSDPFHANGLAWQGAAAQGASEEGKISLRVSLIINCTGLHFPIKDRPHYVQPRPSSYSAVGIQRPPGSKFLTATTTVRVPPTATVAEVKKAVQTDPIWRPRWIAGDLEVSTGPNIASTHRLRDDRPLLFYNIHATRVHEKPLVFHCTVTPRERQGESAKAAPAAQEKRAFVHLLIFSPHRVSLCALEADESDSVAAIKRRLHAGEGQGAHHLLPSTLPLAEQHLLFDSSAPYSFPVSAGLVLRDERTLKEYGLLNSFPPTYVDGPDRPRSVPLVWLGRAPAENEDEWHRLTPTLRRHWINALHSIQISIDLLNSPSPLALQPSTAEGGPPVDPQVEQGLQRFSTRRLLVDVHLQSTVASLKQRISHEHPRYTRHSALPAYNMHLFCPTHSNNDEMSELSDSMILEEAGVGHNSLGLKWEATPQEKAAERELKAWVEDRRGAHEREQERERGKAEGTSASALSAASAEGDASAMDTEDDSWVHPPLSVMGTQQPTVAAVSDAPRFCVSVSIDPLHAQLLVFYLPTTSLVRELKEAIAKGVAVGPAKAKKKVLGVPVLEQELHMDGLVMRDERSIGWYRGQAGANPFYHPVDVLMTWRRREKKAADGEGDAGEEEKREECMEVQVVQVVQVVGQKLGMQKSRKLVLMLPTATIAELKAVADCPTGAATLTEPPLTRSLSIAPPFLDDSITLSACGVQDGSQVFIDASAVDLHVRLLPADVRHTLRVIPRYTSVGQVKQRIAELPGGIPTSHLCLRYFRGDEFSDGRLTSSVELDERLSLLQLSDQVEEHALANSHTLLAFRTDLPQLHPQDDWADEEWRRRHPEAPLRPESGEEALQLTVQTETNDIFTLLALRSEPLLSVRWRLWAKAGQASPRRTQLFLVQPTDTNSATGHSHSDASFSSPSSSTSASSQLLLLEDDAAPLSSLGMRGGGAYLLRAQPFAVRLTILPGDGQSPFVGCQLSDSVGHLKLLIEREMDGLHAEDARGPQQPPRPQLNPGGVGDTGRVILSQAIAPAQGGFGVNLAALYPFAAPGLVGGASFAAGGPPPPPEGAAGGPRPPPAAVPQSWSRHRQVLRFPGQRTAEVSDDTPLEQLLVQGFAPTAPHLAFPFGPSQETKVLGGIHLLLVDPGDRPIPVEVQVSSKQALRYPMLLYRHELLTQLRQFLARKHGPQLSEAFHNYGGIRLRVNGAHNEDAQTVRDLHLQAGDVICIEPIIPPRQPHLAWGRHRGPEAAEAEEGEEGEDEAADDDEDDEGGMAYHGPMPAVVTSDAGHQRMRIEDDVDAAIIGAYAQPPAPPPVTEGTAQADTSASTTTEQTEKAEPSGPSASATGAKAEDVDDRTGVEYHTSTRYAWLPADFKVANDGSVRCLSYINNLHPVHHAPLYSTVEEVLARFIPLFERVLTDLRSPRPARVPVGVWYDDEELSFEEWKDNRDRQLEEEKEKERNDEEKEEKGGPDDNGDGDGENDEEMKVEEEEEEGGAADEEGCGLDVSDDGDEYEQFERSRPIIQPEALPFAPPPPPTSLVSLRGRTLQVIVKLCHIMLTPAQPRYEGGVWHVEGMRNECVVSSGIAYYDQANISDTRLAFRTAVGDPLYEQGDDRGVLAVYGLANEAAAVQPAGSVLTSAGRCIAFPNVLQHQVQPFTLTDPTLSGHRKILVFFLVDPTQRITSTLRVLPQQAEWSREERAAAYDDVLPVQVLQECVASFDGWPMSLVEAKRHRAGLMKERKFFVQQNTDELFERPFSLCEH